MQGCEFPLLVLVLLFMFFCWSVRGWARSLIDFELGGALLISSMSNWKSALAAGCCSCGLQVALADPQRGWLEGAMCLILMSLHCASEICVHLARWIMDVDLGGARGVPRVGWRWHLSIALLFYK